ncbi:hypothetical protein [Siphonobacter sp. SORGH_AS_1065]|uniref:hypothetical protein n=1 Tax=Siphonobacter sp. SORGH_AS_1065 TaxID=3041795 RepID=UPI002783246A|nr:hypothetical protein [Siphonobacter sp. SORGH_AS_1065]MDQ1087626.1 hypothetical protein [Siphonobacter sp. SORGH_AS_1065]
MKIFTIIICFFYTFCQAQNFPKKTLGSFVAKGKVYSYEFIQDNINNYSFVITSLHSGKMEDSTNNKPIYAKNNANVEYVFSEFSKDIFVVVFKDQMKQLGDFSDNDLRDKSFEIFYKIKASIELIDDEPTTAYFILKDDYISSFLKDYKGGYYNGELTWPIANHEVNNVVIETNNGTIKNIKVHLVEKNIVKHKNHNPRKYLEFINNYPISISGKFDSERFANVNLYCSNCNGVKGLSRFIRLSDLINYDTQLENEKEDYSPVNKIINLNSNNPIVEVRKEKRSKILEVAAFSDLMGLNQSDPNGLIQFEIKRKITLNSKHKLIGSKINKSPISSVNINDDKFKKDDVKFFNKIENTNNKLNVSTVNVDSIKSEKIKAAQIEYTSKKKAYEKRKAEHDTIQKLSKDVLGRRYRKKIFYEDTSSWNKDMIELLKDTIKSIKVTPEVNKVYSKENNVDDKGRVETMEAILDKYNVSGLKLNFNRMYNDKIVIYDVENIKKDSQNILNYSVPKQLFVYYKDFNPNNSVFFNFIDFKLQFTKLEDNNRYIPFDKQNFNDKKIRLRPIDVYRYQLLSFSSILDIYRVNYTQLKFSWSLINMGLSYSNFKTIDSTGNQNERNTSTFQNCITLEPGSSITFRPDSRWGITLGVKYIKQYLWNVDYSLDNKFGLMQYYFDGHHNISDNSKVFFRFKLSNELKHSFYNFTQIQIGYTVDLFNFTNNATKSN